ncbi:hypothetical protein G6F57_017570 [Rhizopus arrhizus]|nr:hypothetical protein G6F57_017570 [Rhizopus arrhizus]
MCSSTKTEVRNRRAHLLRLRHQGQHRLEADAGLGVAPVRGIVPEAADVQPGHHLAGMPQLARTDRPDRTGARQEGDGRRHRCGLQHCGNGRGSGQHPAQGAAVRRCRQAVPEHQLWHGAAGPRCRPGQAARAQRRREDRARGTLGLIPARAWLPAATRFAGYDAASLRTAVGAAGALLLVACRRSRDPPPDARFQLTLADLGGCGRGHGRPAVPSVPHSGIRVGAGGCRIAAAAGCGIAGHDLGCGGRGS